MRALIELLHERLNAGDADGVAALATPDVEVGGPRGSARGADVLADWVQHAHIRLTPRRWFISTAGDVAVVEQDAQWHDPGADTITPPVVTATLFRAADGRVSAILRYDDGVEAALTAAGLDAGAEQP